MAETTRAKLVNRTIDQAGRVRWHRTTSHGQENELRDLGDGDRGRGFRGPAPISGTSRTPVGPSLGPGIFATLLCRKIPPARPRLRHGVRTPLACAKVTTTRT